jgi:hypothetical protein
MCIIPSALITYMGHINKLANPSENEVNELLFADDQVLIREHKEDLQNHMDKLNRIGKQYTMDITIAKTEVMTLAREKQNTIITVYVYNYNDSSKTHCQSRRSTVTYTLTQSGNNRSQKGTIQHYFHSNIVLLVPDVDTRL